MANVLLADVDKYVPVKLATKGLEYLYSNIQTVRLVRKHTDITQDFTVGQKLDIPVPGTWTVAAKAEGSDYVPSVPTDTKVTLTLNKHKYVSTIVEDFAKVMANDTWVSDHMEGMAMALGDQMEDDLIALFAGFSTTTGTSGTNLSYGTLVDTRKKMNDNKVPPNSRHLVMGTKDGAALLKDTDIKSLMTQSLPEWMQMGSLGKLAGFTLWENDRVAVGPPQNNGAFDPGALLFGFRKLPDPLPGSGAVGATVYDQRTQIACRVVIQYQGLKGGHLITFDTLYGVIELRDLKGVLVLS